jgi:hypothetical protein
VRLQLRAPTRTLLHFEAGGPAVGVAAEAPQEPAWSRFTRLRSRTVTRPGRCSRPCSRAGPATVARRARG